MGSTRKKGGSESTDGLDRSAPLAERLRAWSKDDSHKKRTKVTAEDILARQEARKSARETKEAQGAVPKRSAGVMSRRVLAGALVLAAFGVGIATSSAEQAHAERMVELEGRLTQLTDELTDAREESEELELDPEAAADAVREADDAASRVSDLQNQYHFVQVSTEVNPDTGVAELVGQEEYQAIHDGLAEEFSEASQTSGGWDPTLQWFLMWDEVKPGQWETAPGEDYTWSAPEVWSIVDNDTVRVVWQLHEVSTGDLLAWTTAQYHADTGVFDTVVTGTTAQGAKRIAPTDSGMAGNSDNHEPANPDPGTDDPAATEDGQGQ